MGYCLNVKQLPPVPRPVNLNLESTLGCNLECIMCGSHLSGVTKLRRSMGDSLLKKVEAEVMPGITELSLTVAGEPFLTPRLPRFVAVAERFGAWLSLNTNGTLVKDTGLLRRVLRQSNVMRFSVDGATAKTYESIRGLADFDSVITNIETAVAVRRELPKHRRPRLVMCMVLMKRNVHELTQMVELAHGLGLDRLDVAHLTVLVPEMDAESLRHDPQRADAAFKAAMNRADALGFRLNLPPLMNGERLATSKRARMRLALNETRSLNHQRLLRLSRTLYRKATVAAWARKAGGHVPCHFLQDGVFITIQGEVAPCPMPGRPIAGDLHHQSFDEIWNGEVLTRMRRGFIDGQPMDCCAHCSQNPAGYSPADAQTVRPPNYEIAGL
jgi:MoaA/NifB/PqqE/SkfB family radical SAM enzyme